MYFLDVTGPEGGRTVALPNTELRIGSAAECELQLDGAGVDRHHATLVERGGQAVLLSLGSAVTINGKPVFETALLVEGCIITIGSFRMRFRVVDLPPDTIQTMTVRQPTAPPIPLDDSDIEIFSRVPSTHHVLSSELIDSEANAETDPSILAAQPVPPDDQEQDAIESKAPTRRPSFRWGSPPPSSLRASENPVEVEFLRAISEEEDVAAARSVYADWLEEHGDKVRAEYLRALEAITAPGGGADTYRLQRFGFLGKRITDTWRAMVLPPTVPIERCGAPREPGQEPLPCPRTWGALDRISVDDVRRCTVCSSFVHYASTVERAMNKVRGPVVVDLAEERKPGDLVRPELHHVIRGRRSSRASLPAAETSTVTAFYAECARLESLAVTAFAHLYEELTDHGAPAELRRRALEAAHEETEHVRVMEHLAGRPCSWLADFDATAPCKRRSLFEVAHENAVEGCVRETYGALVARHHAEQAASDALDRIARDEASHARLSWDIARWIEPQLCADERRRLLDARRNAAAALLLEAAQPMAPLLVADAGCPDVPTALAFAHEVARRVAAASF